MMGITLGLGSTEFACAKPSASFQTAHGQISFVPSQKVAQFMQVSQPHFRPKHRLIALGVIPEILQIQEDLWWQEAVLSPFLTVRRAGEQAKDVRLESLID